MKYLILVPDGLADEPAEELNGKTPLEAANTPNLDFLATNGMTGLVKVIPDGMPPGSDVGNLSLMGYDPRKSLSGRAALEAASMGILLAEDEIAFRCNLVTVSDGKMADYSAGHIKSHEAEILIKELAQAVNRDDIVFYPGKSYRHIMVLKGVSPKRMQAVRCTPPHDIMGQEIRKFLPDGPGKEILLAVMERSKDLLAGHSINKVRVDLGENPANMAWLWGQGARPQLQTFSERWGVQGSVISAVDLVNGIGRLAGLTVIDVPGATGYYDTNYVGKAQYAIESLKDRDFVFVHVEAMDEAGHNGDVRAKISCLEKFDRDVVGTVLDHFNGREDVRILVSPDHPTPFHLRTHTRAPVPFVLFGQGISSVGATGYGESEAAKFGLKFNSGEDMVKGLFKG